MQQHLLVQSLHILQLDLLSDEVDRPFVHGILGDDGAAGGVLHDAEAEALALLGGASRVALGAAVTGRSAAACRRH